MPRARGVPPALGPSGSFATYLGHLSTQDRYSGAVLIAQGGHVLLQEAYGLRDRARRLPTHIDTKFNLGSASKMFTAVAIAQLAEKKKLTLNDTIGTYLRGFPPAIARHVTIRQLLTHTSGMGDFFQDPRYRPRTMQTVAQVLRVIEREPLHFPPGSRFSYSNSGYVVLGGVVEAISGQDYYSYVRDHIFRVAGMGASGFYRRGSLVPNLAHGYTRMNGTGRMSPGAARDNLGSLPLRGSPAGGGYSTVGDMLRFSLALRRHRLLNPTETAQVMMGRVQMRSPDGALLPHAWYGYGFGNFLFDGERIVGHNGGAPGIAASFDMFPAAGYTAVMLANQDPGTDFRSAVSLERGTIARALK